MSIRIRIDRRALRRLLERLDPPTVLAELDLERVRREVAAAATAPAPRQTGRFRGGADL